MVIITHWVLQALEPYSPLLLEGKLTKFLDCCQPPTFSYVFKKPAAGVEEESLPGMVGVWWAVNH